MKRQHYFPRLTAGRPEWFHNYATELPLANATLGLVAGDVTATVADAKDCEYASGAWLTATREYGPAATSGLEELFYGSGPDPYVLPVFTAPPLPAGTVAVAPGALQRIFAFVQVIKTCPAYTNAIGLQLGIVGPEDTTEHLLPEFTTKNERGGGCECVKIIFKKFGHKGVVVYSKRGGGGWEMLAIDLASPYLDERPLLDPTKPEVREYRLQFYEDDGPTGGFTDIVTVTVAP